MKSLFGGEFTFNLCLVSSEEATLHVELSDKYKTYLMAKLPMKLADRETLRQSLNYRYHRMRSKEVMLKEHWEHMVSVIRLKNPSLLLSYS